MFHFPIKERLEALLWNSPAFAEALHHEIFREKPAAGIVAGKCCLLLITCFCLNNCLNCTCVDVYDSPAWKKMMGEQKDKLERIGILFCIDGIPAFKYKVVFAIDNLNNLATYYLHTHHHLLVCCILQGLSLMPGEFMILSLPPWLRYKENNILMSLLIPEHLSAPSQLKYFKRVIRDELNDLVRTGIRGPDGNIKVLVFGQVGVCISRTCILIQRIQLFCPPAKQSLDLKGREKFLDQRPVNSYVSCAHCVAKFPKGLTGPIFGIARQYLCRGHRLRQRVCAPFQYMAPEPALPPPLKDTAFVKYAATQAVAQNMVHFLGQKGDPMFSDLLNFSYENMSPPDWAHNVARIFVWLCSKVLVGPNGEGALSDQAKSSVKNSDAAHRAQSQSHRVFPDIWPDAPIFLDAEVANLLRDIPPESIATAPSKWCKGWWKTCCKKVPTGTGVAALRAQIREWQLTLQNTGRLQIKTGLQHLGLYIPNNLYFFISVFDCRDWKTTLEANPGSH